MYQIITGPILWLSFAIFIIGCLVRIIMYIKGLDWQADRVAYTTQMSYGLKGAARSIILWLFPFGTRSWRVKPLYTIIFFLFHICLIVTPIFLLAHNIILRERFGFSLPTLPEPLSNIMTIVVILTALFIIIRRIALPEVRILTTFYDFLILVISAAPFITGLFAYYLAPDYNFWLIAHIISGEIMLVAIPFTKLSHFVLFFMSRAQLGMDYGIKRGGMKKSFAW
jgi:nitrate reductase gamma subunit